MKIKSYFSRTVEDAMASARQELSGRVASEYRAPPESHRRVRFFATLEPPTTPSQHPPQAALPHLRLQAPG
jgi:hypothetical protein